MCHREGVARLVLGRGKPDVLAWVAELEGDLEHPGEPLVPLGSGLHRHRSKARSAQGPGPVDAQAARQLRVSGVSRLPIRQRQPATRPEQPQRLARRRRGVGRKVQSIDGHHGVGGGIGQAGGGKVTNHKPCPVGQSEQRGPVSCMPHGDG